MKRSSDLFDGIVSNTTAVSPLTVTIAAATTLEVRAIAAEVAPGPTLLRTGIALSRAVPRSTVVISCGLAGGLSTGLLCGTVVVPRYVSRPEGPEIACDAELVAALTAAAQSLGYACSNEPLVTAPRVIVGSERARFAQRGFAAADMESALIEVQRFACVRVLLDTPAHEIAPEWSEPLRAFLNPRAWRDLPFLAREGPRCARIAARVVGRALDVLMRAGGAKSETF